MTCQETSELIQRSLDKDLSEGENEAMMQHLTHCSNCTSMYERMQHLSNDLATLSKVTPPYSLVDRIIPQLDEIDRLSAKGIQQVPINSGSRVSTWKNRLANSAFKTWGGVVAAGIIFAVVVTNGIPSFQQNADHSSANHSAEMNTALSADSNNSTANESQIESFTDQMEKPFSEGISEPRDATSLDEMEKAPISMLEKSELMDTTADEEGSTSGMDGGSHEDEPMYGITGLEDGKAQNKGPESLEEHLSSPNGEYIANIKRDVNQQQVIITDKNGVQIYASERHEVDQILNPQWSEDSLFFEYDIATGESVMHLIIEL